MTKSNKQPANADKSLSVLYSESKALHVSARLLTVLIAVGAFVLSFAALTELAEASGIPRSLSWVWALSVDGFILINTIAAFSLQDKGGSRIYAWIILGLFVLLSIFGNAWHAVLATTDFTLPLPVAVLVTAIPPLTLFLSIHLLILMVQPSEKQKVEAEKVAKRRERLNAVEEREIEKLEREAKALEIRNSKAANMVYGRPATPALPARPAHIQTSLPPTGVTPAQYPPVAPGEALTGSENTPVPAQQQGSGEPAILNENQVREILTDLLERNQKLPTGKEVATWLGKGERTGQNFIKKFKEENGVI